MFRDFSSKNQNIRLSLAFKVMATLTSSSSNSLQWVFYTDKDEIWVTLTLTNFQTRLRGDSAFTLVYELHNGVHFTTVNTTSQRLQH